MNTLIEINEYNFDKNIQKHKLNIVLFYNESKSSLEFMNNLNQCIKDDKDINWCKIQEKCGKKIMIRYEISTTPYLLVLYGDNKVDGLYGLCWTKIASADKIASFLKIHFINITNERNNANEKKE